VCAACAAHASSDSDITCADNGWGNKRPAAGGVAPFSTGEWSTDFTRRTIAWEDVISGGPPKDGIPAIDAPTFDAINAAAHG
jgi:hypothetical protein